MTLKTSLIITGDSSGGVKAADDLTQSLDRTRAAATGVTAPVQQIDKAQTAAAASATKLVAANDAVASGAATVTQQVTGLGGAQTAAASGADAHSAAMAGLQTEIKAIVAQVASGSSVFAAMADRGDGVAAALQKVADASGVATAGIGRAGTSGKEASADIGELAGSVLDAGSKVEATGAKFSLAAGIVGGVWGAALGVAVSIGASLLDGLLQEGSALDAEIEKLKQNAAQTGVSAQAKAAYQNSVEGVAAAIAEATEATKKAITVERTAAEQENITTRQLVAKEIAIRATTKARLEDTRVLLQAQITSASAPGQRGEVASLGVGQLQGQLADLDHQIDVADNRIAEAQKAYERSRLALAAESAKGVDDAIAGINRKYDVELARLNKVKDSEIALGKVVGAATQRQFDDIERRRKAALDAEAERERKKPKPTAARQVSIGAQVQGDQAAQILRDAQRYTGLSENRTGDRGQLKDLFEKANVNIDPRMVAWCAGFVNAVLATDGIKGTGSLSARSFLDFGEATNKPNKGDIVVSKRGDDPAQGHVGFYQGTDAKGRVLVLGGNTGDRVGTQAVNRSDVLGFRRAPSPADQFASEQKGAADALKQQAQDLAQVTAKYLPAVQAAKEYADELERIDALAKSYDPNKEGSGLSPALAAQAKAAVTAARDKRLAELQLTPEAKAADDAKKSIDGVIGSLQQEIATRQAAGPVEAAMIERRKELAELAKVDPAAAAAREAELRQLYAQDAAERAIAEATRDAAQAQEQFRNLALDALDSFIVRGEKAGDVIKHLAQTIASAALEAAVFGTGPLAALLHAPAVAGAPAGQPAPDALPKTQAAADLTSKAFAKAIGDKLDSVFGKGGGGKALQYAGYGYTAGSLSGGSGTGGAIGGAIGGALAGKFLSGALGSFAGPLGSIAGGLLGGIVGNLFGKSKAYGSSTLQISDGAATAGTAIGQGSAERDKATALGGGLADTLNKIAQTLGGTLGTANVSIGYRPGHKDGAYRVDTTGGGRVTGVQAFEDENAAIAYAARDAIADGVIGGISAAVAKALNSSTDVDKALKEALKVQDIEVLVGGIGAEIDKAFGDFEATAKERVRIAQQYGFDLVAIEKRNAEDRAKLADELLKKQVGSLQSLLEEITHGELFDGNAIDKIAAINEAIGKARADLDAGVDGAGDTLANLYSQRLAASKDAYATTSGYAADRNATISEATAAVARANAQITAAQAKSDPALATTNEALDENNDQNAQILEALKTNNALLAKLGGAGGASYNGFDLASLAAV